MADLKISQLTSATLPLAGTEVLPIVQSSTTKKVATDNLTIKNVRSNATTGILQIAGPAAAATRTMTVPDANFTAARIDAAQSFTGDQTLSTGNLVIGTSGKGIDFSATPGTGTSELLADYEEGTWTPAVRDGVFGTAATASSTIGQYTKIGRTVQFQIQIENINTSGLTAGNTIFVTGFPFTVADTYPVATVVPDSISSTAGSIIALLYQGTVVCALYNGITTGISGAQVSQITSGAGDLYITGVYQTT